MNDDDDIALYFVAGVAVGVFPGIVIGVMWVMCL